MYWLHRLLPGLQPPASHIISAQELMYFNWTARCFQLEPAEDFKSDPDFV